MSARKPAELNEDELTQVSGGKTMRVTDMKKLSKEEQENGLQESLSFIQG